MKRCSQCDFIYEDDQHLCDMDGQDLVYEPTLQSLQLNPVSAAIGRPSASVDSRARHQLLAAAVAVLIATVLSVGYSGFTSEYAPQNTKAPSTNVLPARQPTIDHTPAPPVVSPTPSPTESPLLEKNKARSRVTPVERSTGDAPRRQPLRSESEKANHKKESGIGGFLKKTGKILKRPFKF